jgi:hypothetical protein
VPFAPHPYPTSAGLNVDAIILCVLDPLQLTDGRKLTTPVDWRPGHEVIIALSVSDEAAGAVPGRLADRQAPPVSTAVQQHAALKQSRPSSCWHTGWAAMARWRPAFFAKFA